MKVAIYCRLSEEDKFKTGENSESIQNQRSMLINYAVEKGWEIYNIYCDENYSGIDSERPQYNQMLEDAKNRCFDIILCKTQSRFSRNMEHIEKYLNGKLQEWGIRFVSVVDNVDTDIRSNKKARQINGLINEWYLEDLSENVRAVLTNKHREGKSTRAFMPYGFKKSENDKNKVEIDDDAAWVVKEIFNLFLKDYKTTEIANILNDKGILCPQNYKISKGEKLNIPKKSREGKWTPQAILRILKNPMYAGDLVHNIYNKPSYKNKRVVKNQPENWHIVKNSHTPIVSREDFEMVGQKLCKGKVDFNIICGECGCKMYVQSTKYKEKSYKYLWCKKCKKRISAEYIEKFLTSKYKGKIEKIEIPNQYSANVFFEK